MEPGFSSNIMVIMEMSVEYRICVLCGRFMVHSSGVGWRMNTHPPLLQVTLEPYFLPMRSVECLMTPYLVCVTEPCCTFTGNMDSWPRNTIAVSPSFIVSPYSTKLMVIILYLAGDCHLEKNKYVRKVSQDHGGAEPTDTKPSNFIFSNTEQNHTVQIRC